MKTIPLRYLADINPTAPAFDSLDSDESVLFLPLEAVWNDSRADFSRRAAKENVATGYVRFERGDVVSPKVTPTFQAGRSTLVPGTGAGSTELHVLRARHGVDPRWVAYALRSKHFLEEGVTAFQGVAGLQRVPAEFLAEYRVVDNAAEEQRRIADFLDDRVAGIDQVIAARHAQANLEMERFRSSRELAIRGIDGGTTRSVDGWLGRLNAAWNIRRLGQVVAFYAGAAFPVEEQGASDGDLPFLKVSDLSAAGPSRVVAGAANWVSTGQAARLGAKCAPPDTILFPKVGAALLTNNRAIAGREVVFDNNVMGICFRQGSSRYWLHVMSCVDMGVLSNPGPVPSVSREGVAEISVPWPPSRTQEEIAARIDGHSHELTTRVDTLNRSASLLQEYKQSLITAAVTGELDVTTASRKIPETL